jgi:hypothetical protein
MPDGGISGKHIGARIGGVAPVLVPGVQSWTADDTAQELDGTTAEDEGFENPDDGLASLSVNMELVIDIVSGSLTPISRGTLITDLKLYADIDAGTPIYHCPLFKVFKSTPKGEINGRFMYSVQGKSKGPFFLADPN